MHVRTRRYSAMHGFGLLSSFAALPSQVKTFILDNRPENPNETNGLLTGADGLLKVKDWYNRWQAADALSQQVDTIRNDPASDALNRVETGLANALTTALLNARNYFPWGAAFSRTSANQAGLDAALDSLDNGLTQYMDQVGSLLNEARNTIKNRQATANQLVVSTNQARTAQANLITTSSQAQTAVAAKALAKATRPAWVIPAMVGGGAILLLGLVGVVMKLRKKKATAVAGYRRAR